RTGLQTGSMNADTIDHRVGTGSVNIFKDAQSGLAAAVGAVAAQAVFVQDHDLTRLHIPQELGADAVQSAGLGGYYIASVNGAQTERTESLGVTGRNDLLGGHDDQRVCTL